MPDGLAKILENYKQVQQEPSAQFQPRHRSYAVSALRGGVGKSTLAFNLAYELSRIDSILVADVCPQQNLTETFFRGRPHQVNIMDALLPQVAGPAFGEAPEDISYRISELNDYFKKTKRAYIVPGSPEFFAFPSSLYQQLNQANVNMRNAQAKVSNLLFSLRDVLQRQAVEKKCNLLLMDTSPFYGGGTHLAWCAADALVIPVRVDEHSIEALDLTLSHLVDERRDFQLWNARAGVTATPRVAAIAMTMVGAKSQLTLTPDRASQLFIGRALQIAEKHHALFDVDDPADAFVLLDDFMSSGRISGVEGIPIAELEVGKFHTIEEGKRLQVNKSADRYKNEIRYLASLL